MDASRLGCGPALPHDLLDNPQEADAAQASALADGAAAHAPLENLHGVAPTSG
jgi:hypothetical protein